jgi:hypothetical protein
MAAEAGAVISSADDNSVAVVAPMRARDRNRGMAHHFCVVIGVNAAVLRPPMSSSGSDSHAYIRLKDGTEPTVRCQSVRFAKGFT